MSLFLSFAVSSAADDVEPSAVPPAIGEDAPPTKAEITERIKALTAGKALRSASGHFLVVGTNRAENLAFAGWAEDTAARLDKVLGIPSPFDSRTIHLSIRSGRTPAGGVVLAREDRAGDGFVQRMTLWNHGKVDVEEARQVLCRLLLAGHLTGTIERKSGTRGVDIGVRNSVPLWLAEGLAQYVDPALRGPNAMDVIGRWEKGGLASVADFLRADGKVLKTDTAEGAVMDRSMSAVLVNWLLAAPGKRDRFREMIRRLDAGGAIDAPWLAGSLGEGASPGQLEEAWDYWLHGRRRVVYVPGKATPAAIALFKGGLLLYPGNCGIPLTVDFGGAADLKELIRRRDEEWVAGFCARKSRSLRLMTVGRGDEFGAVAERFCGFLGAVGAGDSEERLTVLLEEAEKALAELEVGQKDGDAEDNSGGH